MTDTLTLTGLVATTPRHLTTSEGLQITSFRLASTQRRFDRGSQKWIDGETNWYTVTAFRQLALNVVASVMKGQRVVVSGRLRIRDWESGDRAGTTVEIDADALGHDIAWGTSVFTRSVASTVANDGDASAVADANTAAADAAAQSDRAAVLDRDVSDGDVSDPDSDSEADSDVSSETGEFASARSKRGTEVALPF
jgi:single-strand DNA-binding protein